MPLIPKKNPMPSQEPQERVCNFKEVALGYTEELALKEAERCLNCKSAPCTKGCPVGIDIPAFINKMKEKDFEGAITKIKEKSNLPAICGRVCPQENQCEKYCTLGRKHEAVAIGRLERFLADYQLKNNKVNTVNKAPSTGFKVAVIGSGPAGLTAAGDLARMGHEVTVFEALHVPGGVLMYGIPEFRLPKEIVQKEIDTIRELGVEIKTNSVIGKMKTVDELLEEGYDAVFISTGAGLPYFMGIEGENLNGVYSANEFLTRTNLMKGYLYPEYATPVNVGKKVAVIGAGNVAMDAARTALRLGAEESYIVYRRSAEEMPARKEEVEHAEEEGVKFLFLTSPIKFIGDDKGQLKGMVCQRFELGEPDASGRRRPIPIPGSEYEMEIDTAIIAIGQGPNPLVPSTTPGLELKERGNIITDDKTATSREGVFAGGDVVTGAATVILAMGAGKKAAQSIDAYLREKKEKKN
ncbi:MAG: glutamate synthase small chain [Clostridia bacterium]|nr:glutamate synthase small chain [Clostridia bacterium]